MFVFVILTSILINVVLIIYSYKLPFFNAKGQTDNEKMLLAASKITYFLGHQTYIILKMLGQN